MGSAIEQRLRDLSVEERADTLVESLTTARDRVQDLSLELGRRASASSRRSAEAARIALEQARASAESLPDLEEVGDLTRRAGERLFRERAKARRRESRRRTGKLLLIGAALGGLGVAIGRLTAPRRGPAADQVGKLVGGEEPRTPLDMQTGAVPPADVVLVPGNGHYPDGPRSD